MVMSNSDDGNRSVCGDCGADGDGSDGGVGDSDGGVMVIVW